MTSVDRDTPVHKGSNALASKSAAFLVSDSPGHIDSDDVTAKGSFLKNPDLMAITFSYLIVVGSYRCFLNAVLTF